MRIHVVYCTFAMSLLAARVHGEEQILEFVAGLRARGYYDIAVQYLNEVSERPNLPQEVRQILPYERAQVLLAGSAELNDRSAQRKQLDAAQAALEEFVKGAPNHPLIGEANSERANILMRKGIVEIMEAESPSNEGSKEKIREQARSLLAQARTIFEQARNQHQATLDSLKGFIPQEDKVRYAAREAASNHYMKAVLHLAETTYWEGQSYDRGSSQRNEVLVRAADEFEKVHEAYRSQIAGLTARLLQGKCFEEQDNTRIALGIYGELLGHEGQSPEMVNLKDKVLRYRLICLNHDKEHDYKVVENEATQWLANAGARTRTEVGLGIQWELCRAQEALGLDPKAPEAQRRNLLTQALSRARGINRYETEFKAASSAMIQRIMVALNRDPGAPKDFDTAYGQGGLLYDQIVTLNENIRKLAADRKLAEVVEQQETLKATGGEMARMYDLALKLAQPDTDRRLTDIARTRLAYGYLQQGRFYDAAAVAEHQMLRHSQDSPEAARESGFIALVAFDYAYSDTAADNRQFEADMVTQFAEKLATLWPDSDRANDARNTVAKLHWDADDYVQAAEWWKKIPPGTSQYADAQIRAGQAYWRQYVLQSVKPAAERSASTELVNWKSSAIKHLETGLAEAESAISDESPFPDDFVRAKLTLVTIRNLDGIYSTKGEIAGALELLTKPPHALTSAVEIPAGQTRPADPTRATSREIASQTFQQLLRTQIGLKNLDAARQAREQLEKVAGSEDASALTQVYVDFGRELHLELERLQAAGEQVRLNEVRTAFEGFLNDLFNRPDGQSFYSLLWIAETYASLGDGSTDSQDKAADFFAKATTTYRSILEKTASDPLFGVNEQQLQACRLRLVNTLRRQKNFTEAESEVKSILKSNPNAPDAQIEAARLYQDWGGDAAPDSWKKYEIALSGEKQDVNIWGWAFTANALQRQVFSKADPKLENLLFDARYNLAACEREFGKAHPDNNERTVHLQRALASITGFQRLSKRWPDDQYTRFNTLYRSILGDLGNPVIDLPRELRDRGAPPGETSPVSQSQEVATANVEATPAPTTATAAEPEARSNLPLVLGILALGGGVVATIFNFSVMQNKRKRAYSPGTVSKASGIERGEPALPQLAGLAAMPEVPSFDFDAEEADPGFNPAILTATKPMTVKPPAARPRTSPPAQPAAAGADKPRTNPSSPRPRPAGEGVPPATKRPAAASGTTPADVKRTPKPITGEQQPPARTRPPAPPKAPGEESSPRPRPKKPPE